MIKYTFTKNNFKKYLKKKRRITNLVFLIIGSLLYFYITYYLLFTNPFETFIYYLLYLVILLVVIVFFNELYCIIYIRKNKNILGNYEVDIKTDKIIVKIDDSNYEYLNKNIKKVKNNKNYILIKFNNHISLLFLKDIIDDNNFRTIKKYFN